LKKGMGNRMPVSAAFWIFLLIVMVIAFFMLLPRLGIGSRESGVENREQITDNREQGTDERKEKKEEGRKEDEGTNSNSKEQVANSKERDKREEEKKPQGEKTAAPEQKETEKKPQAEKPVTPAQPSTPPAQPATPPVKPVETRDRSIYLIQKTNDGAPLVLVKVNRKLNVTNTPLQDGINALLAGPTPDEIMRGMENLVPEGSRLLSARVEGSTAVLDFNQEFRYNPRGSEGCAAQIKQIVWTATEFPNVKDVQFLIEGRKVDFLSEGVVINRPIERYAETAPR